MKKLVVLLMLASSIASLAAQESAFSLSLPADLSLGGAALALVGLPLFLDPASGPQTPVAMIPAFDRAFIAPYSASLDDLSSYAAYATLVLPASILLFVPGDTQTLTTYALMYGEAFLLTWGLKESIKATAPRWRPYSYSGSIPPGQEEDYYASMPSGHTALAFMSASFLIATLVFEKVDANYAVPLAVGSYALAGAIAWLRVDSGNHFPSDVLVGALLGSAVGWLVPALHLDSQSSGGAPTVGFGKGLSFEVGFDL